MYYLVRIFTRIFIRLIYRVRVYGLDKLPKTGPLMLVANHVTLVDGFLLAVHSPRKLRFLMAEEIYNRSLIKPWAKFLGFIPVPLAKNPGALKEVYTRVQALLRAGEAVCIFPEGKLTTNGAMTEFKKGFLRMIPDDLEVPIVPCHLGLLWGSIFSLYYKTIKLRKPRNYPYPVIINFADPMPKDISASEARRRIAELASDSLKKDAPGDKIFTEHFIKMAHMHPLKKLMQDSNGTEISNSQLLIKAYALSTIIRRESADEEYVGIMLPASTSGIAMCFAVMLADKIPVFLNFTASKDSIDYAMKNCQMTKIYTSKAFSEKMTLPESQNYLYLEELAKGIGTMTKLKAMLNALLPSWLARRIHFPKSASSMENTATILFSSGSTGTPKGVVLSHRNFYANLNAVVQIIRLDRGDAILGSLPFFHSFGYLVTIWLPVWWGVKVLYHPNPLDAEAIGNLVEKHKLSILFATPTFLQAYQRKCSPEQFKTIRVVVTGAEKLQDKTAQAFFEKFGVMPVEGYGCTETAPVISVNLPAATHDLGKKVGRQGSVGQPLEGVAVRIFDPETNEPLDDDEEGLLFVNGPNVMKEYLNDPERTEKVLKDGWYNTGDIAKTDSDGYIFITGRLSRFSKVAGEMVPHGAVEEELLSIIGSSDEQLLVVSSIEDALRGERLVVLHMKLEKDPKDIVAELRKTGLPNLWIPKPKDFYLIEAIPLLGTGKLDLQAIQKLAKESAA